MRKADRLFEIVQILRRSRGPVTAHVIAEELETSTRSIYRDMAALMARRVPITGEAGVGYVLERGFDMPPLMLVADELDAVVLGANWVATRGEPELAKAARNLIAKIEAITPERLRPHIFEPSTSVTPQKATKPKPSVHQSCGQPFGQGIRFGSAIETRPTKTPKGSYGRYCLDIAMLAAFSRLGANCAADSAIFVPRE